MTTGCNGCDAQWGGNNTAHCSACHRTFTGIVTFDKHRKNRKCLDPATVRDTHGEIVLRLSNRAYPCWGLAGERPDFWEDD